MDHRNDRRWSYYINCLIGKELSTMVKYYDRVIHWLPRPYDTGVVLACAETREKFTISEDEEFPDLSAEQSQRTAILLNGVFNYDFDIEGLLQKLDQKLARTTRIVTIVYNPYLSWMYKLANRIGLRQGTAPTTFITRVDLANIAKLTGFELVRSRTVGYFPWKLFGVGDIINKICSVLPIVRLFGFAYIAVLRPIIAEQNTSPSLTCLVPARNEKGNIENIIQRLPKIAGEMEIIFVEGNSTDGTWEEIIRVQQHYKNQFNIHAYQQPGIGKADAVRFGFAKSTGQLLTILDADLTMPPEFLQRYYRAYCLGLGDFINGSRLVYPMEGEAMQFLNHVGNIFFARALSWCLDVKLGDTLCGTKLLARHDYERFIAWRKDFGDFDPFGDFELLFPAAVMALGIIDLPVRYRARTYGATNISRFEHGLVLFKMVIHGFFRIKLTKSG